MNDDGNWDNNREQNFIIDEGSDRYTVQSQAHERRGGRRETTCTSISVIYIKNVGFTSKDRIFFLSQNVYLKKLFFYLKSCLRRKKADKIDDMSWHLLY